MRLKVLAIVALLVVAGGAVAVSLGLVKAPSTTSATTFLTATASTQDVTDEVTATGNVAAAWTYDLAFGSDPTATAAGASAASSSSSNSSNSSSNASSVTWPVTSVSVKVGDRVTKGQVLAKADTTDLEAQIADANRAAASSAIQVQQADDALAAASGTDPVRQAKINLYNAETQKAKAYSDLADLKALRTKAALMAPADGVVTAVNLSQGVDAPSGTAITLASAALEVTTNAVESDVTKISVGQQATVTVGAINATLNGTVTSIAPSANSASGNNGVVEYAVQISLDAPPQSLRPGMSADVSIVTASASGVLAIPARALSGTAGNYTVRVVAADGTVATRAVTVGLLTSSLAEIQSGLQAGERVVTGTSSSQQTAGQGGGGFFGGGGARGLGGGTVVTNR